MSATDKLRARATKIDRLRIGGVPRVLELCSGSGGLALGLRTAGFELSAHVEVDHLAAETYGLNFDSPAENRESWAEPRDMVASSAAELAHDLLLDAHTTEAFDILAAGLPCQAFARIGRSKLRDVAGDDDAFRKDPRAGLYRRFLEYVEDTQPLVVIIENVPDILNFGGHNVPEEICETLERMGYDAAYTILNAAYYGVPQIRERLFLIAIADDLKVAPEFPEPTHFVDLPRGYEGSRRVALKHVPEASLRFRPIHDPSPALAPAVSAEEALGDLPAITEHQTAPKTMRRRKLSDGFAYDGLADSSEYARAMRTWPGFESVGQVGGHLVRLTPRDFPIFRSMPNGADYPTARAVAERMLREALQRQGLDGEDPAHPAVVALRKSMVPPYDPGKFPNKWWKMDRTKPSRTLTAHIGKDTYSHIHYDSAQARTISVREAARLQSFPDGFRFAGAMNAAFRQIGNAVPPLLGLAVARAIRAQLDIALVSVETHPRVA